MLSKGPVGRPGRGWWSSPYFLWNREWRRLLDRNLVWGILVFLAVAAPWYVVVSVETKGEYIRKFIGYENLSRFTTPMEGHRGPPFDYLGALLALFAPWSCFIGLTSWYAVKGSRNQIPSGTGWAFKWSKRLHRFLLCWFVAYLVFFSAAATKFPNYIGPLYRLRGPPDRPVPDPLGGAARQPGELDDGRRGRVRSLTGLLVGFGLLAAGGAVELPAAGMRIFPGLASWAWVGLIPVAAAGVMAWGLWSGNRPVAVAAPDRGCGRVGRSNGSRTRGGGGSIQVGEGTGP